MGRTPPGLAAPEVADLLGVPRAIVEDWFERGLLPSRTGDDRVRRTSRRNITVLQESSALDSGKRWTEADWEALLDRLGPVLRDPTSLRPSLLGRILDYLPWSLP
ncbi:MAG: hypothetical protein U0667_14240 [Chloroflexota bacterium]